MTSEELKAVLGRVPKLRQLCLDVDTATTNGSHSFACEELGGYFEENRDLLDALDHLAQENARLQDAVKPICAFCGHKSPVPNDHEDFVNTMAAHMLECEKHPMRAAMDENAELRNEVEALQAGNPHTYQLRQRAADAEADLADYHQACAAKDEAIAAAKNQILMDHTEIKQLREAVLDLARYGNPTYHNRILKKHAATIAKCREGK